MRYRQHYKAFAVIPLYEFSSRTASTLMACGLLQMNAGLVGVRFEDLVSVTERSGVPCHKRLCE